MSQLSRSAEYFSSLQLALGTKSTITTAAFSKSFFQQNIILFHTTSYQEPKRQNHRTFPKMLYNMKYTSVIILGFLNALAFAVPTTPDASVERSIEERASLLTPAQLASLAELEAQSAAAIASQLASLTASILTLVGG